jgi:hypothetical protein
MLMLYSAFIIVGKIIRGLNINYSLGLFWSLSSYHKEKFT